MSWKRAGAVAAVSLTLSSAVAACSSSTDRFAQHSNAPTGEHGDSITTTRSPSTATSSSQSSIPTRSTRAAAACTPAQLRLTRRSQRNGGSGPGNYSAVYLVVNDRSTPCTVSGFPQVSFARDTGTQVGTAAPPLRSESRPASVTLGPGDGADFTLHAAVFEGPRCPGGIQTADQMRVVPSGQSTGVVLTGPFYFCALTGVTAFEPAR